MCTCTLFRRCTLSQADLCHAFFRIVASHDWGNRSKTVLCLTQTKCSKAATLCIFLGCNNFETTSRGIGVFFVSQIKSSKLYHHYFKGLNYFILIYTDISTSIFCYPIRQGMINKSWAYFTSVCLKIWYFSYEYHIAQIKGQRICICLASVLYYIFRGRCAAWNFI